MIRPSRTLRVLLPLAGLAGLAVLGTRYSPTGVLTLVDWGHRHWTVIAAGLLVLFLIRPLFLWPLSILSVFAGYTLGIWRGVPLVLVGTLLTCVLPFLVAKRYGGDIPHLDRLGTRGEKVVTVTGELRGMVAARLSPAPADAVSYGAGISGVSLKAFAVGTLIGELPWATFYVLAGQSLRTFAEPTLTGPKLQTILIAGVASVLVLARPLYGFVVDSLGRHGEGSN